MVAGSSGFGLLSSPPPVPFLAIYSLVNTIPLVLPPVDPPGVASTLSVPGFSTVPSLTTRPLI